MNGLKRGCKAIDLKTGKPRPLSTLLSVNTTPYTISNFKLYCELFRDDFTDDEILKFIPYTRDFKKYLPFWDKTRYSSLCFGFKQNKELQPTKYTYLKIRYENVKNEFEVNQLNIPYKTDFVGVAFEYFWIYDLCIKKKYWYYDDKDDIKFIISKFGLEETVLNHPINHIEYTEFQSGESKIIVVYDYYDCINFNHQFLPTLIENGNFSKSTKDVVKFMKETFNLNPHYFGVYDENFTSIYWSLTRTPLIDTRFNAIIDNYNV
jgi:hypothetical protein